MKFTYPELKEFQYPEYQLKLNPFVLDAPAIEDESLNYVNRVYNREAKRVVARLIDWIAAGETSKLWIVKDMSVDEDHHIGLSGAILRYLMAHEDSLRVFQTLCLLTVIHKTLANTILQMILDRFHKKQYRRCLFAYVCESLQKIETEEIALDAAAGVDIAALIRDIEETNGKLLDQILYRTEMKASENADQDRDEDEATDEGDASEISSNGDGTPQIEADVAEAPEEDEEETKRLDMLRELVLQAVAINMEGSNFGFLGRESVNRGLNSLESGFTFIKAGGFSLDAASDVLKFMASYYRTTFVLIDRVDTWAYLDEEERSRVYGEVSSWQWTIGKKGCMAWAAGPLFEEDVDPAFLANIPKVMVDFKDIERDAALKVEFEEGVSIVERFLSTVRPAGSEPSIVPFTEGAIKAMVEKVGGDVVAFIDEAGRLLESAASQGLPEISAETVAAPVS